MSKSKGNVVNPDSIVEHFGADALRLYEMFLGPFDQPVAWQTDSIAGVYRFLERVWALSDKVADVATDEKTDLLLNQTIDKVTRDIESLKMNTAVSSLMILSNAFAESEKVPKKSYEIFLQLFAPFAPHIAHELAEKLGFKREGWEAWPVADAAKLVAATAHVAVQINGKVRATIELPVNASEQEALAAARAGAAKWFAAGKELKAIYVPGKVVNFVLESI